MKNGTAKVSGPYLQDRGEGWSRLLPNVRLFSDSERFRLNTAGLLRPSAALFIRVRGWPGGGDGRHRLS
jgi:hypothetical protein